VLSPNLTIDEAKVLQGSAAAAGYYSSYIWTFGIPMQPTPECSTTKVYEHIVTSLDVRSEAIYIYILKQQLWRNKDQYAEVYFFPKKPWADDVKPEQFRQRMKALAPADYLEMNVHNGESISLPLSKMDASFTLEIHAVLKYANVTVCFN
jgi:hypothetical protein